jgi:hypothetical protein
MLEADLAAFIADAAEFGMDYAVIKGPALAHRYYADTAERDFTDVDVLVRPRDVALWRSHLDRCGLSSSLWETCLAEGRSEIALAWSHTNYLDLHWGLINERSIREQFNWDIDGMLSRRTLRRIGPMETWTLDAADELANVCVHACMEGADRLVWQVDIDRLVRHGEVNWALFTEATVRARTNLIAAVMLQRTSLLLGTPLPPDLLRSLGGRSAWLVLTRLATWLRPPQSVSGRAISGRLLIMSTRSSTSSSLKELLRRVCFDLVGPVLTDREHPWRARHAQRRRDRRG